MQGRRRDDVRWGDLPDDVQPGDIWRYLNYDGTPVSARVMYPNSQAVSGNLADTVWGYMPPNGDGIGTLGIHTVRENDDGTVSVLPGDGSSNSILHQGRDTWHGYIYNGEWRSV
jgi:hypothetical protein